MKETLVILPDKMLVIKGSRIGAISYEEINIHVYSIGFIESEKVPRDAIIIDYTWEKVNKNGTPEVFVQLVLKLNNNGKDQLT